MAVEREKVDVYRVAWICDECGEGEMVPTGTQFPTYPPQYQHQCDNRECRHTASSMGETYPKIEYE